MRLAAAEPEAITPAEGGSVESTPVVIASEGGLHARPAAAVAAVARRFAADVRLVKSGREANARSVVSIMVLEVGNGDAVTVVARGEDAAAAAAAVVQALASSAPAAPGGETRRPVADLGPGRRDFRRTQSRPVRSARRRSAAGVPASPGVAIGHVFQLRQTDEVPRSAAADPSHERRALDAAIAAAHASSRRCSRGWPSEGDADRAAIFAAHQELLEDPEVLDGAADADPSRRLGGLRVAAGVHGAGRPAAWRSTPSCSRAAPPTCATSAGACCISSSGRDGTRSRSRRSRSSSPRTSRRPTPRRSIARACAASARRRAARRRTWRSSRAGWASPRSPASTRACSSFPPATRVVLDGDAGTLDAAPTPAEEARIAERQAADARARAASARWPWQPAVTSDGHRVEVVAQHRRRRGGAQRAGARRRRRRAAAHRVPLHGPAHGARPRTSRRAAYEAIARALGPERILVIRTLDVGGDKPLSYLPIAAEANPFLGERGIRLTAEPPRALRARSCARSCGRRVRAKWR